MLHKLSTFLFVVAYMNQACCSRQTQLNGKLLSSHLRAGSAFEWSGLFETPEAKYLWSAQKVDGQYADDTMKLVALPARDSSPESLKELSEKAKGYLTNACRPGMYVLLTAGKTITPAEDTCFLLQFDEHSWQTIFEVDTSASPYTVFFSEHRPSTFESSSNHFLKDVMGFDADAALEVTAATTTSGKPWGEAIGAALVVNAVTFSGVVFLVPTVTAVAKRHGAAFSALVAAFASGALLSCAFNILLFESTHLIAMGYTEEKEVTWRWGAMILSGFLVSTTVDCAISFFSDGSKAHNPVNAAALSPAACMDGSEQENQGTSAQPAAEGRLAWCLENPSQDETSNLKVLPPAPSDASLVGRDGAGGAAEVCKGVPWTEERATLRERARLIGGVLIGDFFHNLCDGVFIGAAFSTCSPAMGWSVASATVIHEVAQELSDFTVLTSPGQGALSAVAALALNFVSGLSVVIGVLVVLASGVADASAGLILAFGGGVYIHVGAAECMPRVYRLQVSPRVRFLCLVAFVLGAAAIGLVLINHEHCSKAESDAGDAHGHAHSH